MSEMEMKIDMEVEDFTDELSDEALDRAEGGHLRCASFLRPFDSVRPWRPVANR